MLMNEVVIQWNNIKSKSNYMDLVKQYGFQENHINQINLVVSLLQNKNTQRFFINEKSINDLIKSINLSTIGNFHEIFLNLPYNEFWFETQKIGTFIYPAENYIYTVFGFWLSENNQPNTISYYVSRIYNNSGELGWEIIPFSDPNHDREETIRLCKSHFDIVLKTLLLINSPKISEIKEFSGTEKINKKRIKRGKEPLLSYKILDLTKETKARMNSDTLNEGTIAFHARRGHYAMLSSDRYKNKGLIWRKNTLVGNKKNGEIVKGYLK